MMLSKDIVLRENDGKQMVFNTDNGDFFKTNKIGFLILKEISKGNMNNNEIFSKLKNVFSNINESKLKDDFNAFIESSLKSGIIVT